LFTDFPVVKPRTVVAGQQISVYNSLTLLEGDVEKPKVFIKTLVCKVGEYAVSTNRCFAVLDVSCDSLARIEIPMRAGMSKQVDANGSLLKTLDEWGLKHGRKDVMTRQRLSIPHDAQPGAYDVWYTAGISESASCDGVREWLPARYERIHIGRGD